MTTHTDLTEVAQNIRELVSQADRILLLSHVNPDGDAIGSLLGLWHALCSLDKQVIPLASSPYPAFLHTLPGSEYLQTYQPGNSLPPADLIWMVDTANPERVGPIHEDHAALLQQLPLIIVDHHITNNGAGAINLIDPHAASTAELLYDLLCVMDIPISPAAATCLLMGITTDTQSFQVNSTRPASLRAAAALIELGADHYSIVQNVYYALPYSTASLVGLSLAQLQRDQGVVWTHISQAMYTETGADDGAYDEVVAVMQRIEGMRIAALFKERGPTEVKISLRSKRDIDVSQIAQQWGGGGHAQAAGATLRMDLAAAQQAVLPALRAALTRAKTAAAV